MIYLQETGVDYPTYGGHKTPEGVNPGDYEVVFGPPAAGESPKAPEAPGDSLSWGQLAMMSTTSVETLKAVADSFDPTLMEKFSQKQRAYMLGKENVDAAAAAGVSWQSPEWVSLTDVIAENLGVRSKATIGKHAMKTMGPVVTAVAPTYKLLPGALVSKTMEEIGGVTAPKPPTNWLLIGALALGAFLLFGRR